MSVTFKTIKEKVFQKTGISISEDAYDKFYFPIIELYIKERQKNGDGTFIIGLAGIPGSGKTILATIIQATLENLGHNTARISIDDFYKNIKERKIMMESGNPFYSISRGLPGTHDIKKLKEILKSAKKGKAFLIPRFDKSIKQGFGDTYGTTSVRRRQDFIILEGWCVGMPELDYDQFLDLVKKDKVSETAINELSPTKPHTESMLNYLKEYQEIWKSLDNLTILTGEKLSWIMEWRLEQEVRLIKDKGEGMSESEIMSFVQIYMPLCSLYFDDMFIKNAEFILRLQKDHSPKELIIR